MKKIENENQNFNDITKIVDKYGSVIVCNKGKPSYIVANFSGDDLVLTDDEKLEVVAKRILVKHKKAFEVLGQ